MGRQGVEKDFDINTAGLNQWCEEETLTRVEKPNANADNKPVTLLYFHVVWIHCCV